VKLGAIPQFSKRFNQFFINALLNYPFPRLFPTPFLPNAYSATVPMQKTQLPAQFTRRAFYVLSSCISSGSGGYLRSISKQLTPSFQAAIQCRI
jgi:hypothetical protein